MQRYDSVYLVTTLVDGFSFNFARTLDLYSISFQRGIFSCGLDVETLLLPSWVKHDDKNEYGILRWRIPLSHNGFHDVDVDVDLEKYPQENQRCSNKRAFSIFSLNFQLLLSEFLPWAWLWMYRKSPVKKCGNEIRKRHQNLYGRNACHKYAPVPFSFDWDFPYTRNKARPNSWRKILYKALEISEAFFDRARFGCEHSTSFQGVNMQNKHGGSIRSHDMNKYKFFEKSKSPKRHLSCCSWQQDTENVYEPCIILVSGRSYKNRNLNLECNDW